MNPLFEKLVSTATNRYKELIQAYTCACRNTGRAAGARLTASTDTDFLYRERDYFHWRGRMEALELVLHLLNIENEKLNPPTWDGKDEPEVDDDENQYRN